MDEQKLPALAYALAEKVGGVPMRYREDGEQIIILMVDGRKFYFDREEPDTSPSIEIPTPPASVPQPPPDIRPEEATVTRHPTPVTSSKKGGKHK